VRVRVNGESAVDALKRQLDAIKAPGETNLNGHGNNAAGNGIQPTNRDSGDVHVVVPIQDNEGTFDIELRLGARAVCSPATRSALRTITGVIDVEIS
ncbi:MAG: hypothetical protein AAGA22_09450, partial [Pseudomonadota bacterium]